MKASEYGGSDGHPQPFPHELLAWEKLQLVMKSGDPTDAEAGSDVEVS